jgi:hypothetical protein
MYETAAGNTEKIQQRFGTYTAHVCQPPTPNLGAREAVAA